MYAIVCNEAAPRVLSSIIALSAFSIVSGRLKGVAFVDQIVFSFSGNHFSHAMALGDVNGDGARDIHAHNKVLKRPTVAQHVTTTPSL